jgi:hypothetical protein
VAEGPNKPEGRPTGAWSILGPASKTSQAPKERSRTWDPEEWEEDQRFVEAMDMVSRGYKREALGRLQQLCQDDETHMEARLQALYLAMELRILDIVDGYLEAALQYQTRKHGPQGTTELYRQIRTSVPDMAWPERVLVFCLIAGEKAKDPRVILDATKMLLLRFPESSSLPRAFLASAEVQVSEGRSDLAVGTLMNLIQRYPMDALAVLAERRLRELQGGGRNSMSPPSRTFDAPSRVQNAPAPNTSRNSLLPKK